MEIKEEMKKGLGNNRILTFNAKTGGGNEYRHFTECLRNAFEKFVAYKSQSNINMTNIINQQTRSLELG